MSKLSDYPTITRSLCEQFLFEHNTKYLYKGHSLVTHFTLPMRQIWIRYEVDDSLIFDPSLYMSHDMKLDVDILLAYSRDKKIDSIIS